MDVQDASVVTREAVEWCYRLFLGREPVNLSVVDQHLGQPSLEHVRRFFVTHPEFQSFLQKAHATKSRQYAIPSFLLSNISEDAVLASKFNATMRNIGSQLCTRSQFDEAEYKKWCDDLKTRPSLHRKQWEHVYILEALKQAGVLRDGSKGVGFGTGREPLPSLFASKKISVLATDAPPLVAPAWSDGSQHTSQLEALWYDNIVGEEDFKKFVSFRQVNMNEIPADIAGFDFCWSSCCFEHLGSIERGLEFVLNSLETLRPGGVAVHTTEFNLSSNDDTMTAGHTVIFRKQDIEELAVRVAAAGHRLWPLNFFPGLDPVDAHVDLPPFRNLPHLKLQLGDYVCTSIGLIVTKQERQPGGVKWSPKSGKMARRDSRV